MYQNDANLVHRELINAIFKGEKMPTSIKRPDSVHVIGLSQKRAFGGSGLKKSVG